MVKNLSKDYIKKYIKCKFNLLKWFRNSRIKRRRYAYGLVFLSKKNTSKRLVNQHKLSLSYLLGYNLIKP